MAAAVLLLLSSCEFFGDLFGPDDEGGPEGTWNESVWNENNWQ